MKRSLALFAVVLSAIVAFANTSLGNRAARAYEAREWASAQALYQLVYDAKPDSALAYGRTIVASMMRGDSAVVPTTVERALTAQIPLDTVLRAVETASFSIGSGNVYPRVLHILSSSLPYLRRPLNSRLLEYYSFRCDGPQMIHYANILLQGLPDDATYLNALAWGYFYSGNIAMARHTLQRLVAAHPDNVRALLTLAETLAESDPDTALTLLTRAYGIHPTPYLRAKIDTLSKK